MLRCDRDIGHAHLVFRLKRHSDGKWTESVLYRFQKGTGIQPYAGLTFNPAGKLYGTTVYGGPGGGGVVFELVPRSGGVWGYGLLYAFNGKPAEHPNGSLVLDKAGKVYGTAVNCGNIKQCQGVVFEVTP